MAEASDGEGRGLSGCGAVAAQGPVQVRRVVGRSLRSSRRGELLGRISILVAANLRAGELDRYELPELKQFSADR